MLYIRTRRKILTLARGRIINKILFETIYIRRVLVWYNVTFRVWRIVITGWREIENHVSFLPMCVFYWELYFNDGSKIKVPHVCSNNMRLEFLSFRRNQTTRLFDSIWWCICVSGKVWRRYYTVDSFEYNITHVYPSYIYKGVTLG